MTIDPNPDLVESLQERFSSNGPDGVYAYASGWMSAMIVRAAKEHAEHCADCQTCHDLSELLSAVAAVQIINPPAVDWLDRPRDGRRPAGGRGGLARMAAPGMRREAKWAAAGGIAFVVLLEVFGVLERLSWWLLIALALAIGALTAYVGDAIWHWRRREK